MPSCESAQNGLNTAAGAAVYSPVVLKLYDWWVLGISNRFAWQCSTKKVLLPFFKKYLSKKHLDVGVGTGFYLVHAELTQSNEVTLFDLNENSLRAAAGRVKQAEVRVITGDVMHSSCEPQDRAYDSISLFYLLHCLPGTMRDKEVAISNLSRYLSSNGVLYGATILGDEAGHNRFGRLLMKIYNRRGLFSNRTDSIDNLKWILRRHFESVQVWRHNKVALFVAREPIMITRLDAQRTSVRASMNMEDVGIEQNL